MCAKQKTETESYRKVEQVVPTSLHEALNMRAMELDGRVIYHNLMELVVSDENLKSALEQVVSNRGSPGIDNMSVFELRGYHSEPRFDRESTFWSSAR